VPVLLKLDRPATDAVWRDFYALMNALASSPIPIAVAITGLAPAGGTVLALFCDWRVAAEGDSKIGLSEVQVGLPLPPVILSALRRLVGARPVGINPNTVSADFAAGMSISWRACLAPYGITATMFVSRRDFMWARA
jgi:enoyl-CoA hydratase/carnithine racemase